MRKKRLPSSHKSSFLLDENVSNNLKKHLKSKGYAVITVQELNKRGIKNSQLLKLARNENRILITYDKDFLSLKLKPEDSLIIINIHPLIDENVLPAFNFILQSLSTIDFNKNIIVLYEKDFISNEKT